MFAGRLKTYLTINTAFFLFFGMLMIDLVIVRLDQKALVKAEISKGFILIAAFENMLQQDAAQQDDFLNIKTRSLFRNIFKQSGFTSAFFSDPKNLKNYSFGECGVNRNQLILLTQKARLTEKKIISFYGSAWNVFWKKERYLVISSPLTIDQNKTAGVSLVLDLVEIYIRPGIHNGLFLFTS